MATNLRASRKKGKHFIVHTKAMHGRPYDGHTLGKAGENIEEIIGRLPERFIVDKVYKGHKWGEPRTKVFQSGQKRGVTPAIKRDIKRRSVIEPIIGHAKNDGLFLCFFAKKGLLQYCQSVNPIPKHNLDYFSFR